ncbi:hypothetical protein PN498_17680 [Oscillatoria sp. CS-180]|nr:hypothetical protein [Oscillatoria sp. CS-180]MDB9527830.1 hypothetical protein [Oscillatoria sp. CS-180]
MSTQQCPGAQHQPDGLPSCPGGTSDGHGIENFYDCDRPDCHTLELND